MAALTVSDVMRRDIATLPEDAPYKQVVRVLAADHVRAVPVVDALGRLSGMVSESDLMVRQAHRRIGSERGHWRGRASRKAHAKTAIDLMTSPVVRVAADTPLPMAAAIAADADVRELAVLDADGRLTGMVDRADLLADYLRPDSDIRHEIVDVVVRDQFCVDPATVRVVVQDGVVTLTGCLERPALVEYLVTAVRDVPGVVDVQEHLSWRHQPDRPRPHPLPLP